jgi:hypothetical protein
MACIIVGVVLFMHRRLERGFSPVYQDIEFLGILSGPEAAQMYIPGLRMLYVFLPSALIAVFSILWLPTDAVIRTMQPLATMDRGGSANETILLEYITDTLPVIAWKAILNGHWRVAWFNMLAVFSSVAPVIAGGIFRLTPRKDNPKLRHVSLSRSNFYGTFAILCIYLISSFFARPPMCFRLRDLS